MHCSRFRFRPVVTRALVLISSLCASCTATPLPLPPEMDPSHMELRAASQDWVTFSGREGVLDPPAVHRLLVTNRERTATPILFETEPTGAFLVEISGALDDVYLFSSRNDGEENEPILECTTNGRGGVRSTDSPPDAPDPLDRDGDGFPAEEDCDDEDPTVNPATPEICDGRDNDCDGELDEGCSTCTNDADCGDELFCNGAERCLVGVCSRGEAVSCDDSDPSTFDFCSEISRSCASE